MCSEAVPGLSSADSCSAFVRNCDEAGLTDVCLTMDSNGFRVSVTSEIADNGTLSARPTC